VNEKSALEKQILFFVLVCVGFLFAAIMSMIPYLIQGISFQELSENPEITYESSASNLRLSLFLNHLFLFLLPSFIYGFYFFKKEILKSFDLHKSPKIVNIILAGLLLFCSYPLINLLHYMNSFIPLADWMKTNEANVAEMLNKIIISDSYVILFLNILLISLMPAIGEELVFRGITQKNLGKILRNGHAAVWISAFLFSVIHFQFEGLLARMGLGAIMGYAYYYTRNFWIPIILHFFNNLIPLLALALFNEDLTQSNSVEEDFNWYFLILPLIGLPLIYFIFKTNNGERNIS
jgi:membrane protease YdiL (CAAX protease family)